MKIYLKKLVLAVLLVTNCSITNAQIDSVRVDTVKAQPVHSKFFRKAIIPTAFIGYGALSLGSSKLRQFDRYINNSTIGPRGYSGTVDDYLRYGPIAVVYGLDLIGIKAKHNFVDRSAMLIMSMAITSTVVTITKNNIYRLRPDGSGISSFPSAHTSMAFMAAEFMNQEYGQKSVWFSVIGYGTATITGVLRLYHHVHWLSDVTMGAGYGILATKLSYLVYPYLKQIFLKQFKSNLSFSPTVQKGYHGFQLRLKV